MKTFTQKDLAVLGRLTDQNLVRRWQGLAQKASAGSIVTIANTGLVNSGKSSLFNALLDAYDQKRFPEGAVRTTVQGDREHVNPSVDLLDTPGIDATDEDDEAAFAAVMSADLILIVHNIKTGMLNAAEYQWIQKIAKGINQKSIPERVVLVCSWIDERERDEGYQQVIEETRRQAFEALGTEVPFWETSAKRYLSAHGAKPGLAKASNIPQFREFLMKQAESARNGLDAARTLEAQTLARETAALLQTLKSEYSSKVSKQEKQIKNDFRIRYSTWDSVLKNFRSRKQTVWDKLNQLKSESRYEYGVLLEEVKQH